MDLREKLKWLNHRINILSGYHTKAWPVEEQLKRLSALFNKEEIIKLTKLERESNIDEFALVDNTEADNKTILYINLLYSKLKNHTNKSNK